MAGNQAKVTDESSQLLKGMPGIILWMVSTTLSHIHSNLTVADLTDFSSEECIGNCENGARKTTTYHQDDIKSKGGEDGAIAIQSARGTEQGSSDIRGKQQGLRNWLS